MGITERLLAQQVTRETRLYIFSLAGQANRILHAVGGHWGVENGLPWVLEVAFVEDQSRVRTGHAPENLAVLRQMAVNLLKQEKTAQGGQQSQTAASWLE
jgi:predicted transposase YbfD/YdcC